MTSYPKFSVVIKLVLAVICCCQGTSCSVNEEYQDDDIKREVRFMLKEYHQAIEEGGLEAEFDYLDQSAEFFWVPPGYQSALSYDSVAYILLQNDPGIAHMSLTWDTLMIQPLRRDLAQFYGIISSITTDTSSRTSKVMLVETGLVIKRSSGWKLLNGQSAAFSAD